jgi:putative transposase
VSGTVFETFLWYNNPHMGRAPRIDLGGYVYHIINRANGRQTLFHDAKDYVFFEKILTEAVEIFDLPLLAYTVMPNHFHFVFFPTQDGVIGQFMQWFTLTHTKRYHVQKKTTGSGHLYQGRYKSFLVQNDNHVLQLIRYVERNPLRANLVRDPLAWKYSSLYRRYKGTEKEQKILGAWPIGEPNNYLERLTIPESEDELEALRRSVNKSTPFGNDDWMLDMVEKLDLFSTTRDGGRPKIY